MPQDRDLVRGLGPWAATALVAGNIIGSGIYVLPGSLAEIAGPASLIAWGVTALGFLALTAVFSDLGGAYPISGGPQAFVQRAFGELAGIEAAFLYWVSLITTNAAYATGFVAYLAIFLPGVADGLPAQLAGQALLWAFCGVNACGVRMVGGTQLVGTLLKAAPLVILSIALLTLADVDNLAPFAPHGIRAVLPAIGLVSFLFLGSESATVPAEEVRGGGPAVRRAGYRGYGLACGIFFLLVGALALGVPSDAIAGSASPLAVAAQRALGPWGERLLTLGALVSIAGALNGWTLVSARVPFAAARAGIAPAMLGRIEPRTGTPLLSLLFSTACASALLLLTFDQSLLHAFNFIVLLSTATTLLAFGGCCASELVLLRREPERFTPAQRRRGGLTTCIGFVMVGVMMAGTGMEVMLLALLTLVPPLAYHRWGRGRRAAPGIRGHNT